MKTLTRRFLDMLCLGSIAFVAKAGLAQSFPQYPVTIVVPYAAGGSADQNARLIAATMGRELGQPVIVINKVGANGNLGSAFVAKARPDGYTLLLGNTTLVMNPFLYNSMPYKPSELATVVVVNQFPLVMVENNAVPAHNVKEFVDYARKNTSKLNYASAALGSSTHLAGELFKLKTGVDMLHVPYSGSMPALTALVSGDVQVFFDTAITALPLIKGGRIRPLAVAGAERLASLPGVPTVIESGFPEFGTVTAWQGIFVPAQTPVDIVDRLRVAVNAVITDPQNRKTLDERGGVFFPPDPTGAASEKFLADERTRWGPLIKGLNLQLEN